MYALLSVCLSKNNNKLRKVESSGSLPEGPRPIGVIPECDLSVLGSYGRSFTQKLYSHWADSKSVCLFGPSLAAGRRD